MAGYKASNDSHGFVGWNPVIANNKHQPIIFRSDGWREDFYEVLAGLVAGEKDSVCWNE